MVVMCTCGGVDGSGHVYLWGVDGSGHVYLWGC